MPRKSVECHLWDDLQRCLRKSMRNYLLIHLIMVLTMPNKHAFGRTTHHFALLPVCILKRLSIYHKNTSFCRDLSWHIGVLLISTFMYLSYSPSATKLHYFWYFFIELLDWSTFSLCSGCCCVFSSSEVTSLLTTGAYLMCF